MEIRTSAAHGKSEQLPGQETGYGRAFEPVFDGDYDNAMQRPRSIPLPVSPRLCRRRWGEAHNLCEEHRDIATASLIEVWIDEA
jgi:hypothetical protein